MKRNKRTLKPWVKTTLLTLAITPLALINWLNLLIDYEIAKRINKD